MTNSLAPKANCPNCHLLATLSQRVFLSIVISLAAGVGYGAEITATGLDPVKRSQEFPWMSTASWERQHAEDVLVAQHDSVDVLFLGDSITAGWDWAVWTQNFVPLKAANFAIGGDHTGNVLWRLQHGTIGNIKPKVVVLMIGVNNFSHLNENPTQVAQGIAGVVQQILLAWPHSKILLNAILPYEADPKSPKRALVKHTNKLIASLADGKSIIFKDYGPVFLNKAGVITPEIMADYLHPTAQGYNLWSQALLPEVKVLLEK